MARTEGGQPCIAAAIVVRDGRVLMVRRRVREGQLSWQFPAGAVEAGENSEDAAVREAGEETGLTVRAVASLGERVHPGTGRRMAYTACEAVSDVAYVADTDELAGIAWISRAEIPEYVPDGFFEPVQQYLDDVLPH